MRGCAVSARGGVPRHGRALVGGADFVFCFCFRGLEVHVHISQCSAWGHVGVIASSAALLILDDMKPLIEREEPETRD